MFDSLAEKLQATLADVRGRGTLTEDDVNAAMREIRLALLEADVNFKVVKSFTGAVKERALGADVVGQLNPGQQVVRIVSDELTDLMGGEAEELTFASSPPTIVVMAGLQGSGKTTATAKLARYLKEERMLRSRWRRATFTGRPPWTSWSSSGPRPASTCTSRAPTRTRSRSPPGHATGLGPRARTS
jgi:signal recognition particle GTPase